MNTSRIELGTIGKIVNILALLAALAGLGLGLYALSGPLYAL